MAGPRQPVVMGRFPGINCSRNRSTRVGALLQSTNVAVLRSRSGRSSVPNIEKPLTETLY